MSKTSFGIKIGSLLTLSTQNFFLQKQSVLRLSISFEIILPGPKLVLPNVPDVFLSVVFKMLLANSELVFTTRLYISGIFPMPNIPPPPDWLISFILRMNSGCVMIKGAASLSNASSCTEYAFGRNDSSNRGFQFFFFFIRQFRNRCFLFLDKVVDMVRIDTNESQVFIVAIPIFWIKCDIIGESKSNTS